MTTPFPEPPLAAGRTIGDILLARGFVTPAKLAEALERQHDTGKPLGQILVEDGAISRLELASALAEQWSDIGSVSPDFGTGLPPSGTEGTLVEIEELRRTRLALEERMLAFERSSDAPRAEHELEERLHLVERALDELRHADRAEIEDLRVALATLGRLADTHAPQLADVVERVEISLTRLTDVEGGVADVSARLAELGSAVEKAFVELERRSTESTVAVADLASDLEKGPLATLSTLAGRLEGIERRLYGLAAAESVADLSARVEALAEGSVDSDIAGRLDDLAHEVDELRSRRSGDPQLVVRLENLNDDVDELRRRLGAGADELEELRRLLGADAEVAAQIGALEARLDALASRPVADGESDARVAELGVRFERLASSVDDLAASAQVARLEERVDALAGYLEQLAARPAGDPDLPARLDEMVQRIDAVSADETGAYAVSLVDELRARVEEVVARTARDGVLEERLAAIDVRVDELAARPAADAALEDRLAPIVARVDELATRPVVDDDANARLDAIASQLSQLEGADAELRAALAAVPPATDDDRLERRLEALGADAASLADRVSRESEARASEVGSIETFLRAITDRLERLETAPPQAPPPQAAPIAPRAAGPPASDDDVERLRMAVERLALDFTEHRRAVTAAMSSREVGGLLEELAARVDELQERAVSGDLTPSTNGDGQAAAAGASHKEMRALTRRLDELEQSAQASKDSVLERLERMMGTIDWRLQRLEHPADSG